MDWTERKGSIKYDMVFGKEKGSQVCYVVMAIFRIYRGTAAILCGQGVHSRSSSSSPTDAQEHFKLHALPLEFFLAVEVVEQRSARACFAFASPSHVTAPEQHDSQQQQDRHHPFHQTRNMLVLPSDWTTLVPGSAGA
eukprot:scaffold8165_cov177-Ochromonas_danica.AAC.11